MKIFLSAVEQQRNVMKEYIKQNKKLHYNLMSFYYINNMELAEGIRDISEEILIDSGAHSFQKGKQVDWDKYTDEYAEFIKKFDRPNVVGYFEMDVDNIIGYDKVLELRKRLEKVSNKIIPVWHKNRGLDEFKKMCKQYAGRVVAITGFKNEDIKDNQYLMFLKYAKKYNCRVHCLGMTRKKILDTVPFDYVDSSSWVQNVVYGRSVDGKKFPRATGDEKQRQYMYNYEASMKMQEKYHKKWQSVCKD